MVVLLLVQDLLAGSLPFVPAPNLLFTLPHYVAGLHGLNSAIMVVLLIWLLYKHWAFGSRGMKMSMGSVEPKA